MIGPVLGAVLVIGVSETVVCAGTGAAIGFLMSSILEDRVLYLVLVLALELVL